MVDPLTDYFFRRPVDTEIVLLNRLKRARQLNPRNVYFQPTPTREFRARATWHNYSPRPQYEILYIGTARRHTMFYTRPVAGPHAGYKFHPPVSEYMPNDVEHRREIVRKVNFLNMAKFNAFIDVTLTPNATTTTITDGRIGTLSAVVPAMAFGADGAAAISAGIYITNQVTGSCTVNHASNASTSQIIRFLIIG